MSEMIKEHAYKETKPETNFAARICNSNTLTAALTCSILMVVFAVCFRPSSDGGGGGGYDPSDTLAKKLAKLEERIDVLSKALEEEDKKYVKVQRTSSVAFYAQLSSTLDRIGNHHIIKFDHVTSNVGGAYNPQSGIFEAPQKGTYVFHWVITNEVKSFMNTELYSNGVVYGKAMSDAMDHPDRAVAANLAVITLEKGDQVWIRSGTWHSGKIQGDNYSTFSGYKLF